ncbi:uncharacterized protein LOC120642853 [Panicum virgatum]|uniref:Uncharacterized protein n=1 Tax=Panicum virgatum TaxID=38727 RepID=A0A8T0Q697_PANVG|nr:uncharacterized protein LOC120642853 [Panicum virgatum]KAG2570411.1 hypothetical protein PVAP13_7KG046763 [Panicum virgatum]
MASTDVIILSSPVASDGFKSKFLASPALAVVQVPADASSSKRQQVKIASKQQQLKPRFALELDGLNCFETLVSR